MFWQEDDTDQGFQVPDDLVNVLFAIDCKRLPVDHAYALSAALCQAAPWLRDDPAVAVHTVHLAGSQNGWQRPEHGTDQFLILSRRTKLTIRVAKVQVPRLLGALEGRTLQVEGSPLTLGAGKPKRLGKEPTLIARYVVTHPGESEDAFLSRAAAELRALEVRVRKALCGKDTPLSTPDGPLATRSLLVANLSPEESVRLQQGGIGPHREMGCGIFIPHKGIEAIHPGG